MEFINFRADANTNNAWGYFNAKLGNKYAAAGLIAAFYVVSECSPYLGWNNYKGYLSTDETCFMKDFVHDKKPFGLAGWNKWYRKQGLFNMARSAGKKIYDLDMQLSFVMDEFSGLTYGPVLEKLKKSENVSDAFTTVMTEYMDISKKLAKEMASHYQKVAEDVLEHYDKPRVFKVPKQYLTTEFEKVVVKSERRKKFPFIRKKLGYLRKNEIYPYIAENVQGTEYAIHYGDTIGYVKVNKSYIVTRLEIV